MKITTAKAAPKKKAHSANNISHMRVEKMDDGTFTSHTHMKPPKRKGGMMGYQPDPEPTTATHQNINAAASHMIAQFGGGDAAPAPGADDTSQAA